MNGARRGLLLIGVVIGVGTGAVARASVAHPRDAGTPVRHEVQMRAVSFAPREISIRLGDTVLFKNSDIVRHNAVRRDVFDTGRLQAGQSYAWVPADTGTFRYQCTIHSRMRGEVRVVP